MKKKIIIISIIILAIITSSIFIILKLNKENIKKNLEITLNGDNEYTLEVKSEYEDELARAFLKGKDLTDKITIENNLDTNTLGTYEIKYKIEYKKIKKEITRTIKIVDTTLPEIKLNGEDETYVVGTDYKESGATALDNYDGDITDKIEISNNIDNKTPGNYTVTYKITDTSGNTSEITRNVTYKVKDTSQKVAVLNYHFFYDPSIGETCNEGNCEDVKDFEAHLKYLKDNNFKTLTIEEFKKWMYGEIEIPEKSVLITIDDGAMGTGTHNGNKLIPLLEKYESHATLFLITGWWGIENYQSDYLDVQSHTHDMHQGSKCTTQPRGAQMLCSTHDQVINDLKQSISILGSSTAFCFPMYVSNEETINDLKEVGFKIAFVGGGTKASRSSDKYRIPRFQITKTTSLETFKNYVN